MTLSIFCRIADLRRALPILALLSLPGFALAAAAPPPIIVVIGEAELRPMLMELAKNWRQESGGSLQIFISPAAAALKQAAYGARADVIFGAGESIAKEGLDAQLLQSADLIGRWRDPLVLVSNRAALAKENPASLATIVAGAPRIATLKDSLSEDALGRLGLANAALRRHVSAADSQDGVFLIQDGAVTEAILYASDLKALSGVTKIAVLPDDLAPPVTIWAGIHAGATNPALPRFAEFLQSPATRSLLQSYGLEKIAP